MTAAPETFSLPEGQRVSLLWTLSSTQASSGKLFFDLTHHGFFCNFDMACIKQIFLEEEKIFCYQPISNAKYWKKVLKKTILLKKYPLFIGLLLCVYVYVSLYTYIYIYIHIYMCVCVWLGSSLSFKHVWLNNKDTFCQYNFIETLSSFFISVLVSDWNWWMNLSKLSQALSDLS